MCELCGDYNPCKPCNPCKPKPCNPCNPCNPCKPCKPCSPCPVFIKPCIQNPVCGKVDIPISVSRLPCKNVCYLVSYSVVIQRDVCNGQDAKVTISLKDSCDCMIDGSRSMTSIRSGCRTVTKVFYVESKKLKCAKLSICTNKPVCINEKDITLTITQIS